MVIKSEWQYFGKIDVKYVQEVTSKKSLQMTKINFAQEQKLHETYAVHCNSVARKVTCLTVREL